MLDPQSVLDHSAPTQTYRIDGLEGDVGVHLRRRRCLLFFCFFFFFFFLFFFWRLEMEFPTPRVSLRRTSSWRLIRRQSSANAEDVEEEEEEEAKK